MPAGVFPPAEAEALFLPFMRDHAELFAGRRVLDIGSGTGVIALYAARLGAASVVATDIDPAAIGAIRQNAEKLGLEGVVTARLVPQQNPTAYSAIEPGEMFDLILSNPPYSLDLDATRSTPLIDTGDLGFSIVRDLSRYLAEDGRAVLLYNSLFYHRLMVKLARHFGHDVRHHDAYGITTWELQALFDTSLRRVLEREGIDLGAFDFDDAELPVLVRRGDDDRVDPLVDGRRGVYRGLIVIRRQAAASPLDDGGERPAGDGG